MELTQIATPTGEGGGIRNTNRQNNNFSNCVLILLRRIE
jgi:hypothetical protein